MATFFRVVFVVRNRSSKIAMIRVLDVLFSSNLAKEMYSVIKSRVNTFNGSLPFYDLTHIVVIFGKGKIQFNFVTFGSINVTFKLT